MEKQSLRPDFSSKLTTRWYQHVTMIWSSYFHSTLLYYDLW